jgi:serine/threonine-protein kinase
MSSGTSPDLAPLTVALADRYRVERQLGAGGMATVYLAQDLRHQRPVAIKVLRPELAAVVGADRFVAEIRTTANLQHPHLLPLFDSGTIDGTVFYVMPFVEGESLRDRLTREKQLPVDEAVQIAREVADALHYAHTHGVIHRDIKPENILLQGGHALVADFGIALAASKTGGTRMTETGMSLGSPHYMSPEQAMGERELDARTDIYALACVTYEMLAGEPPFTGPTAQAIVAKVVTEPAPSARSKRATVSEAVDDAIRVALEKTPADRFRTAADFAAALTTPVATVRRPAAAASHSPSRARMIALGAAGVALLAIGILIGAKLLGASRPLKTFGRTTHVTWDPGLEVTPSLSPDGKSVAYASGSVNDLRIMVRPVGEGRAVSLTRDTATLESEPAWSPDGARILYLARGGAFSAPAGGGAPRPEVPSDSAKPVTSAAWSPDGSRIAFVKAESLYLKDATSTRALARIAEPARCSWSPNGAFIACAAGNSRYVAAGSSFGNLSQSWIALCRVSDGAVTSVTDSLSRNHSPIWSADGREIYFVSNRDGPNDVYAVSISSEGRASGRIERLTTGLGAHTISLAANGSRLAYSRYSSRSSIWSIPLPANPPTSTTAAARLTNANESIEAISLSPDGKWLLFDSDLPGNTDVFRVPLAGGDREQLTTDPSDDFSPRQSPDGREVLFHSWRGGSRDLYITRLDGSGVQQVTHTPAQEALGQWSPDGKSISYSDLSPPFGIWITRRDAAGNWSAGRRLRLGGTGSSWSPDGKSIAFQTAVASGSIHVIPADSGSETTVVESLASIPWMSWEKDGLIYYTRHDAHGNTALWSVNPSGGAPRLLLRYDPVLHPSIRSPFAVGNGRVYFTTDERESDLYVMDVRR